MILVLLVSGTVLGAQNTAILRVGPDPVRGIAFLPPNTLPAFRGEYLIKPAAPGGSPEVRRAEAEGPPPIVEVLYTRQALVLPERWISARCGSLSLLQVSGEERYTLCYRDEREYALFFRFPEREPGPLACRFVESFVRRFQLLLGFLDAAREPPFPAIVELPD